MAALCHDRPVSAVTIRGRARQRLDQLLVERGLAATRSRAQALVLAGQVRVGAGDAARRDRKPGDLVDPRRRSRSIEPEPYVSRGGHKLAAALDAFGDRPGRAGSASTSAPRPAASPTCCSSAARGASTPWTSGAASWPTRCGATRGSSRWSGTNARTLDARACSAEPVDLAVVDVVVHLARPRPRADRRLLRAADGGPIVALVKPQFEAGRGRTDRGRRPRPGRPPRGPPPAWSRRPRELGLAAGDVIASPLLGPAGNREFLLHLDVGRRDPARAGSSTRRSTGCPTIGSRGGRRMTEVRRIGFAYNPTIDAAIELRERAAAGASVRGIGHWAAPVERARRRLVRRAADDRRRSSSSAATARSCAPRGPWPRWTCRCSASTSARSASSPRSRRTSSRACSARSSPATTGSTSGWPARARSVPAGEPGRPDVHRPQRRRRGPRRAGPRRPARRRDRPVAPRHVHRRRPRRREPDRLDRLLVLGRRPDPRPAQPEPRSSRRSPATCRRSARSW